MLEDLTVENPTGLDLTWLGTSSGSPSINRNVSCCVVRSTHAAYLVDTGEGTQRQIIKTAVKTNQIKRCVRERNFLHICIHIPRVRPPPVYLTWFPYPLMCSPPYRRPRIFITHMHGDHCFGLCGMLCTIATARKQAGDETPIYVYGPPGLQEYIITSLEISDTVLAVPVVATELSLDPRHHRPEPVRAKNTRGPILVATLGPDERSRQEPPQGRLRNLGPEPPRSTAANARGNYRAEGSDVERYLAGPALSWTIGVEDGWRVVAAELLHRVPCFGYVFQEPGSVGHVDLAKAEALGLASGPWMREIKAGRPVSSPRDGRLISPKDILGPPIPGRKAVVMGDTWNSTHMAGPAMGCDVLVHEATFNRGMEEKAFISRHSTAEMAGYFAEVVRARALVLTHFSPRYVHQTFSAYAAAIDAAEAEVQDLLGQAKSMYGGHVSAAYDFYTVRVPRREPGQDGGAVPPAPTSAPAPSPASGPGAPRVPSVVRRPGSPMSPRSSNGY